MDTFSKPKDALRKFVAPEFVFGAGARLLVPQYARNLRVRKVLLVTDAGVAKAGWVDEMTDLLCQAGVDYSIFDQLSPNPKSSEVMAGARCFKEQQCDSIVALGGGSPMDCAKGIGIVCSSGGHVLDYEGVDEVPQPCPPLICVPSTAGTSADVSQFAIVNDERRRVKIAIISKAVIPDVSLVDPVVTQTMEPSLTANTGMDALTHAVEALVSNAHSSITDLHALEAIRLVHKHLVRAVHEPKNLEHRTGMMLASLQAGLAFSNASLGAVHAMAHGLGGLLDLPHGMCNAILLPVVIEYNYMSAPEQYAKMATVMSLVDPAATPQVCCEQLIEYVRGLQREVSVAPRLETGGIPPEQIHLLSQMALQDPCIVTNPRRPTLDEVEALYGQIT